MTKAQQAHEDEIRLAMYGPTAMRDMQAAREELKAAKKLAADARKAKKMMYPPIKY